MAIIVQVRTSSGFSLVTLDTLYDDLANSKIVEADGAHFIAVDNGGFNGHVKPIKFDFHGTGLTYLTGVNGGTHLSGGEITNFDILDSSNNVLESWSWSMNFHLFATDFDAALNRYKQGHDPAGDNNPDATLLDAIFKTVDYRFAGGAGSDAFVGANLNDHLLGGPSPDVLNGGAQEDTAEYTNSSGGLIADLSNPANNTGDSAGDTYISIERLRGGSSDDHLTGDANINHLEGGPGADTLDGRGGFDFAKYGGASTGVKASLADPSINTGDALGDVYVSIQGLIGSSFSDILIGDSNDNQLDGGSSAISDNNGDQIGVGSTADVLNGGAGFDYARYATFSPNHQPHQHVDGITASLADPTINTFDAAGDTYISIEGLIGSDFDDTLIGDAGDNRFVGGLGSDKLIGGAGTDIFIMESDALQDSQASPPFVDEVTDYKSGEGDQIDLTLAISSAGASASAVAVRVVPNATGAILQMDLDGAANGLNWTSIANLDGLHAGDTVNVILDPATPAGQTITVQQLPQSVHWSASVDIGPHPFGWLPSGTGDFNADGSSDLLWYNGSNGDVEIWKLVAGNWAGSVDIGSHPAGWAPAGVGDFNHDGTSDVLWYNATNGDAEVWKTNNGQWAGSVDIGMHPLGWQPGGVGDFNKDGTADVLWYNPTNGDAEIWKTQNGVWAGSVDVGPHPLGWRPVGTGDFNRDGTSDIVWFNPTNGDTEIWLVSNAGWAGSVDIGTHPTGWQPVGTGDFNRDGSADIAWFNQSTGHIEVWLIANGQWAGSVDVGSHPAGWEPGGIGDFNHDGISDILWRDTATNHIEDWLLAYS